MIREVEQESMDKHAKQLKSLRSQGREWVMVMTAGITTQCRVGSVWEMRQLRQSLYQYSWGHFPASIPQTALIKHFL